MLRLLVLLAVLILVMSFFGISIRHIIESPTGQDNVQFVTELLQTAWHAVSSWCMTTWHALTSAIPGHGT